MRAWALRAFGDEDPVPWPRVRRALAASIALAALLFATLALARLHTFHEPTFDLAFYARMAWGESHRDVWNPIADAAVYGLHLVWIFEVLGWVGRLFGQANTLLVTQALALALAAWPLARIGGRRLGAEGALAAGLGLLLHPSLSHAAVGEFHPGTVAVLPIAWLLDALDRRSPEGLVAAGIGVLACREDLASVVVLASLTFALGPSTTRQARSVALALALGAAAYLGYFSLVLLPRYAPPEGSLHLHFGHLGRSVPEVLATLVGRPGVLAAHLAAPERLVYLPTILAPLAFLPCLALERVALAAPVLGVALLSQFPTTLRLDSHYLTPALPILVAAAVTGAARLRAGSPRARSLVWLAAAVGAHLAGGATPLGARFDARAYRPDANTAPLRRMVERVGPDASVQAPDRLLAAFAERRELRRGPPPETTSDFVLLDASHRRRLAHDEDLLRTDEEPLVRTWLARDDHALVEAGGDFLLLARGRQPRSGIGFSRSVTTEGGATEGRALTRCLALGDASIEAATEGGGTLVLTLVARGPCPSDLALRVGVGYRPMRVDLIADGLVPPSHLRAGDAIRSAHALTAVELAAIRRAGLRVGALRQSGARPEPDDPPALDVPLR